MPSSRRSSQPRDQTCLFHLLHWQVCPSPLAPPGKPRYLGCTCKRVHEYLCVEYFVLWRRYLMDIWNQKMMIFFHYKREEPQWLPFIRPNKAPSSPTRLIIFLQIQKKNRISVYKPLNIYSPWEHELERTLNRNHYENPNLNIHNAAYTIMFMFSVFNIVDCPLLFSKEGILTCSDKFSIKFL